MAVALFNVADVAVIVMIVMPLLLGNCCTCFHFYSATSLRITGVFVFHFDHPVPYLYVLALPLMVTGINYIIIKNQLLDVTLQLH